MCQQLPPETKEGCMLEGVALVLFRDDTYKEVFFVREKRTKEFIAKQAGMLSIPMDTMEPGESALDAFTRFVPEEVGLELRAVWDIGVLHFPRTSATVPYNIYCFVAVVADPKATPSHTDPDDVDVVGWRPADLLETLGLNGRRELPKIARLLAQM